MADKTTVISEDDTTLPKSKVELQPILDTIFQSISSDTSDPIADVATLKMITHCEPLSGGLSNQNFHLKTPTSDFVLRINTPTSDSLCSRERELFYWQHLAEAGLAPTLHYVSDDRRLYLSDFIKSEPLLCQGLETELYKIDLLKTDSIAQKPLELADTGSSSLSWQCLETQCSAAGFTQSRFALSRSHQSPCSQNSDIGFPNQAHVLLLSLLQALQIQPKGDYHISLTEQWQAYHQQLTALVEKVENRTNAIWQARVDALLAKHDDFAASLKAIEACQLSPQFCHRDLNPHNLLLKDNRLYCIDFEYAIASHPLCDIAAVLATHNLTPSQQAYLSQHYLDSHPHLSADAQRLLPAAIEMYWVFACYWALLMAARSEQGKQMEYLNWFDSFFACITSNQKLG
ncbi:phosphotransferase [Shewanella acanthi]|uniref:phosphotransferase n=1 Tax=Shewanella acanthi TaxID=2864212 RepID=UPI001C66122B|nr:phosphotransferase [Shewanella acanthi]QYJ77583.1 phosphotransferase [Shewanella acanthi]